MSDNGGGFYRGFGRIPSVQTRVEEKDEARNVLRFFWIGFWITLSVETLLYIALNTLFEGWDWYLLFHGLTLLSGFAIHVWLSHRWGDFIEMHLIEGWTFGVHFSWRALIISVSYIVFVWWAAVPTLVRIFNFPEGIGFLDTIRYMASTLSVGALIAVVVPGLALLFRAIVEMADPYRAPVERVVKIEERKTALALKEKDWELEHRELPEDEPTREDMQWLNRLPAPAQTENADERFRLAAMDFMEGLVTGTIGMDERSWATGETLARSRLQLKTALAKKIRDEVLLPFGYMRWIDPDNHRAGIRWRDGWTPEGLLEFMLGGDAKSIGRVED